MATRYKELFESNRVYFITFTIAGWQKIFIDKAYCNLIFKWFLYMEKHYDNRVCGYVIMPNHIHLLLYITSKSPKISTLILNAKRFLAYEIVSLLKGDFKNKEILMYFEDSVYKAESKYRIFEYRYDSLMIRTKKFFLQKLNYIHRNPCRSNWNLAVFPCEYVYSSAANYILGEGAYPVDTTSWQNLP